MTRQADQIRSDSKASEERAPEVLQAGMGVLVVDDDPAVRRLLGVWIEAEGHRVDQVGTGAEAMTQLTTRRYDLVFLDLNMPDLSGSQVLGRLQEYDDRPPVVLITGYSQTPLLDQALHYDLLYVLSKPFTRDQVRKLLHSVRATKDLPYAGPDSRAAPVPDGGPHPFNKDKRLKT
jgi:CheY-like chemotaxis protein